MSIMEPEALMYLARLEGMKRFPKSAQELTPYVIVLSKLAEDDTHAQRVMELIPTACSVWPGLKKFRGAIDETRSFTAPKTKVYTDPRECLRKDRNGNYKHPDMYEERMAIWRREFEEEVKPNLCPDCNGYGIMRDPNDAQKVVRCHCPEGMERCVNKRTGALCQPDDKEAVRYMDAEMVAWRTRIGFEHMISALARMKRMPGGRSDTVEPPPPVSEDRCGECGNLRGYGIVQIGPGFPKRPCVCATREFIEFMAKQPGYEHWAQPHNTWLGYKKREES